MTVYAVYYVQIEHDIRYNEHPDTEITCYLLRGLFETKDKAESFVLEEMREDAERAERDDELPEWARGLLQPEPDPYTETYERYDIEEMPVQ